jgi:endonuclease I
MRIISYLIALFFIGVTSICHAQYFAPAYGLNGAPLKSALHQIISNHTDRGWPLWPYFYKTDSLPINRVWDIYSDNPSLGPAYNLYFGANQCGSYSQEGDCYNHEHTWPSSYFNDAFPAKSDLHHVLPTDGFVNNKRSNFPYGKVTGVVSWTAQNGAKLGKSNTYPNYTLNVFEPIDSFKGDLARIYFYMSTRYEGEDAGWSNWEMANGAVLRDSAVALLMRWHKNDPVSEKEIKRNNAIFVLQNNRNPFVDYPIFADCIWGTADCSGLAINNLVVENKLDIYPNPCSQIVQINLPNKATPERIIVFNMFGQQVVNNEHTNSLSVAQLPAGYYRVDVLWEGTHYRQSLIKQ